MSTLDEFRQLVGEFLKEVETLERKGHAFDRPPSDEKDSRQAASWVSEVTNGLWFFLHDGYQLLDVVPLSPPVLHEVGAEISKIPMIEKWRRGESLTWYDCDYGVSVLAARLREMLEYLRPANTSSLSMAESAQASPVAPKDPPPARKKCGPKPDMDRHRTIARAAQPFGKDWRQHLDEIARVLDDNHVPTIQAWRGLNPRAHTWKRAATDHKDRVADAVRYSLDMTSRKN